MGVPVGKCSLMDQLSTCSVALPPFLVKRTTWYFPSFTGVLLSSTLMSSVPTLNVTPILPCCWNITQINHHDLVLVDFEGIWCMTHPLKGFRQSTCGDISPSYKSLLGQELVGAHLVGSGFVSGAFWTPATSSFVRITEKYMVGIFNPNPSRVLLRTTRLHLCSMQMCSVAAWTGTVGILVEQGQVAGSPNLTCPELQRTCYNLRCVTWDSRRDHVRCLSGPGFHPSGRCWSQQWAGLSWYLVSHWLATQR